MSARRKTPKDAAARVAYDLAGCIVEERNKRNTQNNKING